MALGTHGSGNEHVMGTGSPEGAADAGGGPSGAGGVVVTVLERMLASGIDEARARGRLARGCVQVEGQSVTDASRPAPWPTRWVLAAST